MLNVEVHWLAFLGGNGSLRVRLKGMEAGYPDFAYSVQHLKLAVAASPLFTVMFHSFFSTESQ